jgi:hypothetical protein
MLRHNLLFINATRARREEDITSRGSSGTEQIPLAAQNSTGNTAGIFTKVQLNNKIA